MDGRGSVKLGWFGAWLAVVVSGVVAFRGAALVGAEAEPPLVGRIDEGLRASLQLAPTYQKIIRLRGFPVVGTERVSDAALREAAYLAGSMLAWRPDILDEMASQRVRFSIMASDEYTTDVPEHAGLRPRLYWDRRARGLGATQEAPAVSAAEENLLSFPGDPYPREVIAIHEFAHAIHEMALRRIDPTFDQRLRAAFASARARGLWKGTYAMVNHAEYWAEAVQCWFDNNATNDALHNDVATRERLEEYDPGVAALCREVFLDHPWRYRRAPIRGESGRAHLAGGPAGRIFRWRDEPIPERSEVLLQVADGDIRFILEAIGAQRGADDFLRVIHAGWFSSGRLSVRGDVMTLEPASHLPSGEPVPEPVRRWTLADGGGDGDLRVRWVAGIQVVRQLAKRGGSVPIQRMIRWEEP
jgi:hypothetical protein